MCLTLQAETPKNKRAWKSGPRDPWWEGKRPRGSFQPSPTRAPRVGLLPASREARQDSTGPPPGTPISLGGLPGQSPGCLPSLQPGPAAKRKIPAWDSAFRQLGLTQWGPPGPHSLTPPAQELRPPPCSSCRRASVWLGCCGLGRAAQAVHRRGCPGCCPRARGSWAG